MRARPSTCSPARPGSPRSSSAAGSRSRPTDLATYSEVLSDCYIATDARSGRPRRARRRARPPGRAARASGATSPRPSASRSRFFQPHNGARVDAIRDAIERTTAARPLLPDPAHQPDPGRRPGRLDDRGADGLPQAVGAARRTATSSCACPSCSPARAHASAATPCESSTSSRRSTSRTSTRRTTSTATSPTTTSGRRWSRWDAPAHYGVACKRVDTRDDRDTQRVQPQADDARRAGRRDRARPRPRCSSSRTTTSRGSPRAS